MTDSHLSRRTLMRYGAYGAGAAALAGTAASWDRLTGADIPGRDDGSLVVATLGPAYDPEAIRTLTRGLPRGPPRHQAPDQRGAGRRLVGLLREDPHPDRGGHRPRPRVRRHRGRAAVRPAARRAAGRAG